MVKSDVINEIASLNGIGAQYLLKLEALQIRSVTDLLLYFPYRYQDRSRLYTIEEWLYSENPLPVWLKGRIEHVQHKQIGRNKHLFCTLGQGKKIITLHFFHAQTYHVQRLRVGTEICCYGEVKRSARGFEMLHPEVTFSAAAALQDWPSPFWPIYPSVASISQYQWRRWMKQALSRLQHADWFKEWLPPEILETHHWPALRQAILKVHCPLENNTSIQELALERIAFDELLAHRLALQRVRDGVQQHAALAFKTRAKWTTVLIQQLPFTLTNAQKRVLDDIVHDLAEPVPMLRLVQGDVGSGKTIVAALAMLQVIEAGRQAALMAPTELLAEQHFRALNGWFSSFGIQAELLTSRIKGKERKRILQALLTGECLCVVGTHALFQKEVALPLLSLAVIDEQHRFGVEQRALLLQKNNSNCIPHQLIMTATPIPRTLFMSMYAHLQCSTMNELPKGRLPIQTTVMSVDRRSELLPRIEEACAAGRQVYWVCGLIEESEEHTREAATQLYAFLQEKCSKVTVGLLHGKMNSQQKEQIMRAFINKEISVLVATTVIEVGVDVPNASIIIIENAERFGLSQLHQLRGRVGRGNQASYCILLFQNPLSGFARKRLQVMRETQDGFLIAEQDLSLRGPGEVLGTLQTGENEWRIARFERDQHLFEVAAEMSKCVSEEQSECLIERWMSARLPYHRV